MELKTSKNVTALNDALLGKKPYCQPVVHVYGKLHHLTQGSGPRNGDAGQNMMV